MRRLWTTYLLYPEHFCCQHEVIGSSLGTTTTPCMCLLSLPAGPTICRKHSIQCHTCSFGPINNISLDSDANEWASETYELFVLGRPRVSVKVRVDANPLLRLPGIYSKAQIRTNVFTWPCYSLRVAICSHKAVTSPPCRNQKCAPPWVKKYQSIKWESTVKSCCLFTPLRCRIISTEWTRFYIVGLIIQSSNM